MNSLPLRSAALLTAFLVPTHAIAAALETVGKVEFKRGNVVATVDGAADRELDFEDPVYLRDAVTAGGSSFGIIRFRDQNKLAVRPNSEISIATYLDADVEDAAAVDLRKGGMRVNVKRREATKRSYRIEAGEVAVSVEDAQFDLRRCGPECREENKLLIEGGVPLPDDAVGRAALLRGTVRAVSAEGKKRRLALSGPIFPGDTLHTEARSYLLVVYRDGGRMTVDQNSELQVQAMTDGSGTDTESGKSKLVRGAVRALTGQLAKKNPGGYQVDTPVATTGVRGTGFDLFCKGTCVNKGYAGGALGEDEGRYPDGLYSTVWEGAIFQQNDAGTFDLGNGQTQYIANRNSKPTELPKQPDESKNMLAPRPDTAVDFTYDDLTRDAEKLLASPPVGTWTHVYEGQLTILFKDGREPVTVGAGTTAFYTRNGELLIIPGAPAFMAHDPACAGC